MNEIEYHKEFSVFGKVQGVYFRKSFLFACHRRELSGAVTNDHKDPSLVHCSLKGNQKVIQKFLFDLENISPLNSLGANIVHLLSKPHNILWQDHQYIYHFGDDKVIRPPQLIRVNL